MWNSRGAVRDWRNTLSGKDGLLLNEAGEILMSVDAYQVQIENQVAQYTPLGDAQIHSVYTLYKVTLNFTEAVVESTSMFQDYFTSMIYAGQPTCWTFQGLLGGRHHPNDDFSFTRERIIFRDCVPDGNWDLGNVTPGDIVKRQFALTVNQPPELQDLLSRKY